jgi:hypothetical protein
MNLNKNIILFGLAIALMANIRVLSAEEVSGVTVGLAPVVSDQQSVGQNDSEIQWVWGEVTNLIPQENTFTLKYLDYETDQEKEMVLSVDQSTTFENVKDFSGLKLKDTLSVDYLAGSDNKNTAKNVSLDKPEESVSAIDNSQSAVASSVAQPEVVSDPSGVSSNAAVAENLVQPVSQSAVSPDSSKIENGTFSSATVSAETTVPTSQE